MLLANYTFVLLAMFLLYVSTYPFSFYLISTFYSLFIVITLPVLSAYCTFCSTSLLFKNMLQKLLYKRNNKNKKGPEEYKCNLPNECTAKNKMKDSEDDADISVGTRDRKTCRTSKIICNFH